MATERARPKDAAGAAGAAANGRWATAPVYAVAPADVAAIAHAEHGDPFSVLGPHADGKEGWEIRAFLPQATSAKVLGRDGAMLAEMRKLDPSGFFVAAFAHAGAEAPAYRLGLETAAGPLEIEDPYRFAPILSDFDLHLLHEGSDRELYSKLGAHPATIDDVDGFRFAVWAPNARRVSVVGDFNNWDGRRHPMRKRPQAGVWEIFLPGLAAGASYKFEIRDRSGHLVPLKADPFAFSCEHPPATASRLHGLPQATWNDHGWLAKRGAVEARKSPISIYEVHIGSWMRVADEGDRRLTYRELAQRLVAYVKDMGFTHIELLPITEFPFDGSWGYQPISLFAPTSRHGGPEDFAVFVEACHEAGIGILLDWVPGHFPVDAHGLGQFDGTHLYEHADPRQGFHQDWGTLIYNYGRNEVANFLIASARFWLDRYHLDGLRVDAVASMLYLDYSRKAGEWVPNRHGGNENLDAISFFRRMNEVTYADAPGTMTVAEESTAWPGVSQPTYLGGLGFGFKWNMGWMNDTLRYMQEEPVHRRWHHQQMTFGLVYAFSENFVLPLSHDEVVHGKGSLLTRMPGDNWQKFANLRAYFGFMFAHPGKKLLFMGGEFAQAREWNHDASLDWHLLDDPLHKGMQSLVRDLNGAYRDVPALHERDCEPSGFAWLDAGDAENSVLAWLRRGEQEERIAVCVSNFTPVPRQSYRVGVPYPGWYAERINTDSAFYGGSDVGLGGGRMAEAVPFHGQPYSLELTLPPLATMILVREP